MKQMYNIKTSALTIFLLLFEYYTVLIWLIVNPKRFKFLNFCWNGIKKLLKKFKFYEISRICFIFSNSLSLSLSLSLVFNPNQFCFYFPAIEEETWQRVNKDVCFSPFEGKNFESIQNWCFLPSHSGLNYGIGCIMLIEKLQKLSRFI